MPLEFQDFLETVEGKVGDFPYAAAARPRPIMQRTLYLSLFVSLGWLAGWLLLRADTPSETVLANARQSTPQSPRETTPPPATARASNPPAVVVTEQDWLGELRARSAARVQLHFELSKEAQDFWESCSDAPLPGPQFDAVYSELERKADIAVRLRQSIAAGEGGGVSQPRLEQGLAAELECALQLERLVAGDYRTCDEISVPNWLRERVIGDGMFSSHLSPGARRLIVFRFDASQAPDLFAIKQQLFESMVAGVSAASQATPFEKTIR